MVTPLIDPLTSGIAMACVDLTTPRAAVHDLTVGLKVLTLPLCWAAIGLTEETAPWVRGLLEFVVSFGTGRHFLPQLCTFLHGQPEEWRQEHATAVVDVLHKLVVLRRTFDTDVVRVRTVSLFVGAALAEDGFAKLAYSSR